MNDIIESIKLLEDSGILIDGVIETAKHEIKKQEGGRGREVRRVGREYVDKNFYFRFIISTISRLLIISITNLDLMVFF